MRTDHRAFTFYFDGRLECHKLPTLKNINGGDRHLDS